MIRILLIQQVSFPSLLAGKRTRYATTADRADTLLLNSGGSEGKAHTSFSCVMELPSLKSLYCASSFILEARQISLSLAEFNAKTHWQLMITRR
jgi:hypothetical protein